MATLTLELVRKKAEHHTDGLSTLQELSLHQLNLLHLTPVLSHATPHLRILYLHNNLLPSSLFTSLRRLKSLTYLNLTLNNVTHLPPSLTSLEKLTKLDLTLNHIPLVALCESLASLAALTFLSDLYLTGNPCTGWPHYRAYTLHHLPHLARLDGREVTRTERIEATHLAPSFPSLLSAALALAPSTPSPSAFTPELRLQMYEDSLPPPCSSPLPTPPIPLPPPSTPSSPRAPPCPSSSHPPRTSTAPSPPSATPAATTGA